MFRESEPFAPDQTGHSRTAIKCQRFHALGLLLYCFEGNKLTSRKQGLETGPDQLVVDFFTPCPCSDYVEAYMVVGLGKHQVVHSKQPAVDGSSRLNLECLADHVPR